jgi:hypothetical protein
MVRVNYNNSLTKSMTACPICQKPFGIKTGIKYEIKEKTVYTDTEADDISRLKAQYAELLLRNNKLRETSAVLETKQKQKCDHYEELMRLKDLDLVCSVL